ncbi:autoinducer binding domain-containing protein [Paracoccus sp. SM22M-07]|uniref:helix-turn-helix transcriptional regulator n=1 Tax=Paracoccus sp. SM22M-07 TaxID=1520813 RepID=UPI0009205627|nr:autoinducer binding domain-containing protein [Paracoccus sp. SM22M-07]OJH43414.1 hypothetical protein IE00_16640 [Paracoccus sp. SM22M-07]
MRVDTHLSIWTGLKDSFQKMLDRTTMLEIAIPNYQEQLEEIKAIANSGFVMGFGLRFGQPDFFLNRYPKEWTDLYEEKNYFFGDPVAAWTIAREGSMRWSDCGFPDIRGVMTEAQKFGLHYGATFVTVIAGKRSFLSVARYDRELNDDEMTALMEKIRTWASLFVRAKIALTENELQVLKALHLGLKQSEAATHLGISISGLKARLDGAQKKLGVRNSTSAVSRAVRMNLI